MKVAVSPDAIDEIVCSTALAVELRPVDRVDGVARPGHAIDATSPGARRRKALTPSMRCS